MATMTAMACFLESLVASATIVLLLYWFSAIRTYFRRQKVARHFGCKPPPSIVQRDPIFGLDVVLQLFRALQDNHRNLSIVRLFAEYGPTFHLRSWRSSMIYTIEPQNLQAIFSTDFASWGVQPMRLFAFEPFVGKGIMCTDGETWKRSRNLIKPTFARVQITDLHLTAYAVHVHKLLDLIPRDGSTVDLQPLFGRLALDSSTEFLFGDAVGSLTPGAQSSDAYRFLKAYNYGQFVVGKRLHLPQWNFLTRDKRFWDSCKTAHDFVSICITRARRNVGQSESEKGKPQRYILAQELVERTTDILDIRNQLLNVFLPAHEATGVALTNVFFNLARNPRVYEKLRVEILASEEDRSDWTFERLKSLKYLQYVISETFRLNPAIGTNTRMALRDTMLPTGGGSPADGRPTPVYIRKGDTVTTSFYALHRRQDLFGEDATAYRPERWESLRPPPWSYLTFGGGPRVCPGQNLALTEIAYTIVKIVQAFKSIENRDPVLEFVEVYKITTDSGNGAKVSMVPA